MKRTSLPCLLVAGAVALALAGCGGSGSTAAMESSGAMNDAMLDYKAEMVAEPGYAGAGSTVTMPADDRKIIYTAELNLESKQYDDTLDALLKALAQCGGYVQGSDQGGSAEDGSRWICYTLRVPCDQYNGFLSAAEDAGSLRSKSESTEDVSAQYVDVNARITSLETQRDRLEELAAQAESLEDLITIEDKLSEVQYELESYQAQMRGLDNQISYSTVTVNLDEVESITPVNASFLNRLGQAFANGTTGFVNSAQGLILLLATLWPLLVLAALVLVLLLITRRKHPRPTPAAAGPAVYTAAPGPKYAAPKPTQPVPGEQPSEEK